MHKSDFYNSFYKMFVPFHIGVSIRLKALTLLLISCLVFSTNIDVFISCTTYDRYYITLDVIIGLMLNHEKHWETMKGIISCSSRLRDQGMSFGVGEVTIVTYLNLDYSSCANNRKTTSAFVIMLVGVVSWS